MLTVIPTIPPQHGQLGAVDEVMLFCLPVVIAILVLALTSRQARRKGGENSFAVTTG
jgi:chromate transport protein ChrA